MLNIRTLDLKHSTHLYDLDISKQRKVTGGVLREELTDQDIIGLNSQDPNNPYRQRFLIKLQFASLNG